MSNEPKLGDLDPRIPPHSTQAENSVIGGLLLDNRAIDPVSEILGENDFYFRENREIFQFILKLASRKEPFDVITLSEAMVEAGKDVDGSTLAYLSALAKDTPSAANILSYARIVRDKADKRNLISIGSRIIEDATGEATTGEIISTVESEFLALTEHRESAGPVLASELLQDYFAEMTEREDGKPAGTLTGFVDFDRLTKGLRPGQLVILAARPAMGKTALALNIAEYVAVTNKQPALFFSLEMAKNELLDRLHSSVSGIPLGNLLDGNLDGGDFAAASLKINQGKLIIDESGGLFNLQIRSRARRIKRKHGLKLIIVDYLQLVRAKSERRFDEVSEVSRSLKALAKELRVPILALSQLSRDIESRHDKKPRLSDLRESGQLEQDADLVSFLWRNPDTPGVVEWLIEKQRNGPTGKVHLADQLDRVRFQDHVGEVKIPAPHRGFEYQ